MTDTIHIMFGNDWHRRSYSRAKAINPLYVIVATEPQKIQPMMTENIKTIKVIRHPEEVWKPTTFNCEKNVRETEGIIKGYQRLGVTVVEVTE
ncbi:hypothetical protein SEA_TOKKI_89 [Arthrobacter phage Tokki]|nr:hypothetical protein SEA_TOKKI_89 [Arthrobacter phage Tokki]